MSAGDTRFIGRFEGLALPEAEWTHLAHLRVAWICLTLDAPEAALARIRTGIKCYNAAVLGRPGRYHETVTVAFTRLVAARMQDGEPWPEFAGRIDDLTDPRSPVLLGYYSPERLFSDAARHEFVEPDLADLPPL